jgi:hypothetical protein
MVLIKHTPLTEQLLTSSIATFNGPGIYVLGIRDDIVATVNYTVVDQLIAGAVLVKDLTCAPTPAATNVTILEVGPQQFKLGWEELQQELSNRSYRSVTL